MKENKEELGIPATDANFDSTLTYTYEMLQQKTLELDLQMDSLGSDTAYFALELRNLAGHKFPSGYPSRRAFIEFVVLEEDGDTLFQSGVLDNTYEVKGMDDHYEPHYDVIRSGDQVQIYELVNGDINGQFSTVLERGFQALKDNRLPPLGFSRSHPVYDTTQIAGRALDDPNFNQTDGQEGSGSDQIRYHIPLGDYAGGSIEVKARVLYQSLPPKWMAEMFAASTPEIETFRTMYDRADQSAVEVAARSLEPIYIRGVGTKDLVADANLRVAPNPSSDGWLTVQWQDGQPIERVEVYDLRGRKLAEHQEEFFQLPEEAGIYLLRIIRDGQWWTSKVLRQ